METIVCNYYNLYGVLANNFNFALLLVCLYLF